MKVGHLDLLLLKVRLVPPEVSATDVLDVLDTLKEFLLCLLRVLLDSLDISGHVSVDLVELATEPVYELLFLCFQIAGRDGAYRVNLLVKPFDLLPGKLVCRLDHLQEVVTPPTDGRERLRSEVFHLLFEGSHDSFELLMFCLDFFILDFEGVCKCLACFELIVNFTEVVFDLLILPFLDGDDSFLGLHSYLRVGLDLLVELDVCALQLLDLFLEEADLFVGLVLAEAELASVNGLVEEILVGLN